MTQRSDSVFTPELLKIVKIFGMLSVGVVLIFSFFNEKKASNTGENTEFKMATSDRIYFLNVRSINYEREVRRDAGMTLFRYKKGELYDRPTVGLVIILNFKQDEAYIFLEPVHSDWPIHLRIAKETVSKELKWENEDRFTHMSNVLQIEDWIANGSTVEIETSEGWLSLWETSQEKDALSVILDDYYTLLNRAQ